MSDKAPWITYRPELKVLDCTIRDGGSGQLPPLLRRLRRRRLPRLRGRRHRLHGDRLQELEAHLPRGQVWPLAPLRRGGPASGRRRPQLREDRAQARRHGRRRQERLGDADRPRGGEPAGHDPGRLLRPPGLRGGGHDPARPRPGLRDHRQPDGGVEHHRDRDRHRPGCHRPHPGQHHGDRRQLRLPLPRADRPAVPQVFAGRWRGPARRSASTPTTTCSWPSPTPSRPSSSAATGSTRPCTGSGAGRAIATPSCCSGSCAIPSSTCGPSWRSSRTR